MPRRRPARRRSLPRTQLRDARQMPAARLPRRDPIPSPANRPGRARRRYSASSHPRSTRSEEHTSELQSRRDLVCRLLLEKKKIDLTAIKEFFAVHFTLVVAISLLVSLVVAYLASILPVVKRRKIAIIMLLRLVFLAQRR